MNNSTSNRSTARHRRHDAIVIGAGPAGAVAAMVIARSGFSVLLVDRRAVAGDKFGEALPPAAVGLVEDLLGSLTATTMHRWGLSVTRGNMASWQSAATESTDFFFTPAGHGLSVDRSRFDAALVEAAVHAGAEFEAMTSVRRVDRREHGWRVELKRASGTTQVEAAYLVDASGRSAAVARALGVDRETVDSLFAVGQLWSTQRSDDDAFTRIEAAQDGWWYSQRIPAGRGQGARRRVVFHTDQDLPVAGTAATPDGFADLVARTETLSALLDDRGYEPTGRVRGACAASSRLCQFAGDGWLAVGDAAQAFDPLSAQGITKALGDGLNAAQRICRALRMPREARALLKEYAGRQAQAWIRFVVQQHHYYRTQTRWQNRPFWSRRGQENRARAYQLRDVS